MSILKRTPQRRHRYPRQKTMTTETNSNAGSGCSAATYLPIVATVEWIRGNRLMSDFMANAGLGLSGFGVKERVKITYQPGEQVDEARVLKAVNHMIREADETNADFKISCPRVISISGITTVMNSWNFICRRICCAFRCGVPFCICNSLKAKPITPCSMTGVSTRKYVPSPIGW